MKYLSREHLRIEVAALVAVILFLILFPIYSILAQVAFGGMVAGAPIPANPVQGCSLVSYTLVPGFYATAIAPATTVLRPGQWVLGWHTAIPAGGCVGTVTTFFGFSL